MQMLENVLYSKITETILSIFLNYGSDLQRFAESGRRARCRSLLPGAKLIFFPKLSSHSWKYNT